jgi:hypothetical protein
MKERDRVVCKDKLFSLSAIKKGHLVLTTVMSVTAVSTCEQTNRRV